MKLFHPKKGLLISAGKRYKPVGNKQVDIFKDEQGKMHELDGTEIPQEEIDSLVKEVEDMDMEDQMHTKKEIQEMEAEIDESANEEEEKQAHKEEKMQMHLDMQETIKNASDSVVEAVKAIPEQEDHIQELRDFKDELILAIQTETDKLDKELDLSPVILAIKGIKFPEIPTPTDYTVILNEIKKALPKEINFQSVIEAIKKIPSVKLPEFKFDKEGRLLVSVDRVSFSGGGGFSSVQIENANHEKVNPASEESLQAWLFEKNCAQRVYKNGTDIYMAKAVPGSLTSAPVWKVKKIDVNGNFTWADGNTNQDNIADNFLTLTYL